jgi:MFS family permease
MTKVVSPAAVSERGKWMALVASLLGWRFDGFEIGVFPLTGRPALNELLAGQPADTITQWFGVIVAVFLVGAASGGVLFGWLGDRIGRVRAMSLSILTYAIFTGLCGFATEAWHIAVLRFIASLGMGGEWSLGVALVNELWPNRSRALVAGLIGAAANVGMFLVPVLSLSIASLTATDSGGAAEPAGTASTLDILLRNNAWRLIMIAGALPALLIFFIRLFVPESTKWEEEKRRGATTHFATRDLLGAVVGALGASAVIAIWSPAAAGWPKEMTTAIRAMGTPLGLVVALLGFLFPVWKYLRRSVSAGRTSEDDRQRILGRLLLGAGISGVALLGTWGALQWATKWAQELADSPALHAGEYTQMATAFGAVVGTILAALTADRLGRRSTYVLLCLASIASLVALFQLNKEFGPQFLAFAFLAGGTTAAFYGWFPLYLPELFPTSIRATSQGFAYNFGRVLAAIGTLQTAQVQGLLGGSFPNAGSAIGGIYLVGALLIWLGPETKGRPLPE